jgi:hypothetical protein
LRLAPRRYHAPEVVRRVAEPYGEAYGAQRRLSSFHWRMPSAGRRGGTASPRQSAGWRGRSGSSTAEVRTAPRRTRGPNSGCEEHEGQAEGPQPRLDRNVREREGAAHVSIPVVLDLPLDSSGRSVFRWGRVEI